MVLSCLTAMQEETQSSLLHGVGGQEHDILPLQNGSNACAEPLTYQAFLASQRLWDLHATLTAVKLQSQSSKELLKLIVCR